MADITERLQDSLNGALYGLAIGDALGAPYETLERGTYEVTGNMEESPAELHEGLQEPLPAGTWTDDTWCVLTIDEGLQVI